MAAMTTNAGTAFAPDVQAFDPAEIVPEALVMATSTFTLPVEGDQPSVNVPYVDVDSDAGFVPEGDVIDEADPDTTGVSIFTGKVAVLGKVSREQFIQTEMSALLERSFRRAVVRKANVAYLSQAAPTPPATTPPGGLLAQDHTDGGAVENNLDAVIDAVAAVETAFGAATHLIANPTSWASLAKLKAGTDSNQSLLGAGTDEADRRVLSVPVLTSAAMPEGELLVVDSASVLSAYSPLQVAVSEHAYFASDSIALRVTWRFGAKVVDSERVVSLTINAGS